MQEPEISLIIPAYNEEKKIARDISEAVRFFSKERIQGEIIVSTDGITDSTNEIVRSMQKEIPYLKLLSTKEKIGKGRAIKSGVKIAQGEIIMFADSGYCVPYEYIKVGIRILNLGNDVALASRANSASRILKRQPFYRVLGSRIFGILVRSVLGVPGNITDTQCGFKLYKKNVAKKLFTELRSKKFMFDIEIILLAKKYGFRQKQFPVFWSNDEDTKFNLINGSFDVIADLIRIKFLYRL